MITPLLHPWILLQTSALMPNEPRRSGTIQISLGLCDVSAENASNCNESAVQAAGQFAHSSRSREGNQGKNQQVFDQALASLIFVQPGERIQNESRH
jgi:hypothetical protein